MNAIRVHGQGKGYGKRQTFTDENGKTFLGTFKEARSYFQELYPMTSIKLINEPKKRTKNEPFRR